MELFGFDLEKKPKKSFKLTSGSQSYLRECCSARISQNSKVSGSIPSVYFHKKEYKQTSFPLTRFLFLLSFAHLFYILYECRQMEFHLMEFLPARILKFIFRI